MADALLTPQAAEGHFSYRLLLVRVPPAASADNLNGRVELWSLGRLGDQPREIRVAQARLALLRLQTLAGTLALPVGFEPQRLRVVLHAQGRPTQAFEFAWQGLLNAGQSMTAATPLP